ncbi:MAG TPA: cell division protein FtsL [Limnochordales bacterium]
MVPALKTPNPEPWREWQQPGGVPQERFHPRPRPVNPFVLLPVLGLLVLTAGMGFIAQRVQVMKLGFELRQAQQELARVQEEHRRLQVEIVRARSPERVTALARERLQMVEASRPALVVLSPVEGAEAAVAQAPAAAPSSLAERMAAVGDWLWARLTVAAEAGARRP